ncbi:MAG: nickel pincer cofactor biosynthesis protein LarB [Deltaproteobacteria bacterium]|nr:nickel pincer cofactor biosynthesis protein LarB [Deltaproteobacteria bacterium]
MNPDDISKILDFVQLDHCRELRTGVPEIVFGENKSVSQITAIIKEMREKGSLILISRVDVEKAKSILKEFPEASYHTEARMLYFETARRRPVGRGKICVLAAGTSDLPVAEEAALTASLLGNELEWHYDIGIAGLHRLVERIPKIREASVIIAVAGMEGALPSVVAGLVGRPIIAVPTSVGYGTGLGGFASLMTMLNSCAPGITVVNIDNGVGAAVAAHLMNRL